MSPTWDDITKSLVAKGFNLWMPGASVTGYIVFIRRSHWWAFWSKEIFFLRGGEFMFSGRRKRYEFGPYSTLPPLLNTL